MNFLGRGQTAAGRRCIMTLETDIFFDFVYIHFYNAYQISLNWYIELSCFQKIALPFSVKT